MEWTRRSRLKGRSAGQGHDPLPHGSKIRLTNEDSRTGAPAGCAALLFVRWRGTHVRTVSIAVLPFANMTGDAARDYVCSGITEELIVRLGHLAPGQLRVIAPASAQMYANSDKPPQQIGRELNVQYLIEGSLQQQGANVRVAAQLVRVDDQSRVWANTYEGDLSDQFEFEASVADDSGTLAAKFYGRARIPGFEPGVRVRLAGKVSLRRDGPAMINPVYELR